MISSLTLKNYKSYIEATLPLAPVTFFIGPNASGKSNALEAFRFLNWLARGQQLSEIKRNIETGDVHVRGRVLDLFREKNKPLHIGCHLHESGLDWTDLALELAIREGQLVLKDESISGEENKLPLYRVEGLQYEHTDVINVSYNNFKRGKNKPLLPCTNQQAVFHQLQTPGRFNERDEKAQQTIMQVTKVFREQLGNIVFLDPNPAAMRGYSFAGDDKIRENGANLSSVLCSLCKDKQRKKSVLAFVRSLPEQDITDISFINTERNDVMVRLHESFGSEKGTEAPLLSDGTLRALAIAATLFSAPENALVIIEEVDNGIHPSRAKDLIKQLHTIASQRKLSVLITSHNPALLDAVPDEALGDVLYCYRDLKGGDSKIIRLKDMERFPEIVAQASLGQLITQCTLERSLKNPATSAQRKNAAMSWLAELNKEVDL